MLLRHNGELLAKILFTSPPREQKKASPQIALIVDDIGEDVAAAQALLDLPYHVSFSVLPMATHAPGIAAMVDRCGREVLLHIPMEPLDYPEKNPGRDALFVSYTDSELQRRFRRYLDRVPQASGGNNHMGSRFTENRTKMGVVLSEMGRAGLFYVDSLTSPRSVGLAEARKRDLPAASRDVFLDNVRDVALIERQLLLLIEKASARGKAIGIGHPYPETLMALQAFDSVLRERGVEVVPVSRLLIRKDAGKESVIGKL